MKKLFGLCASSIILFSSCLGDGTPTSQAAGYFTIQTNSNQVVLYMDGGGTFYPTSSSISEVTDGKGFGDATRCWMYLSYPDDLVTYDANKMPIVQQATINTGELIPVANALTKEEAEAKNLLVSDSINAMSSLNAVWAYQGYLTSVFNSKYVISGSYGVRPALNLVLEPNENHPGEFFATLLLNQHIKSESDKVSSDDYKFNQSFDITKFGYDFQKSGLDSVTILLKCEGLKDFTFKIAAKDAFHNFK
ncbi:MAG: hypothetical protein HUJ97_06035 [Bacteroidales bacterium]|nr:hypothetical protein [Bacteroidales bacterium]